MEKVQYCCNVFYLSIASSWNDICIFVIDNVLPIIKTWPWTMYEIFEFPCMGEFQKE